MTDFAAIKRQARKDRTAEFVDQRRKNRQRVERRAVRLRQAVRDGLARVCPQCKRVRYFAQFAEDHGRGYGQVRFGPTVHPACNICRRYERPNE